jgi:hypothetical protein
MGVMLIAVVADVVVVAVAVIGWRLWKHRVRRLVNNRTPSSRPNR